RQQLPRLGVPQALAAGADPSPARSRSSPALLLSRADSVLAARDSARAAARDAEPERRTEPPTYYVIRRGDTFEGIARRIDVSVGALREANPGMDPRRLMPGKSLEVPGS
ncbi:MAG: LysM peptidoglycan-binding domain-containing protein, partial [Gemmatimonadota bacterium]